jgi:hypothetical protein
MALLSHILTRPMGRWLLASLAVALVLPAEISTLHAEESPPREYQIKALFLFNFVQFVDWPEQAFASSDAPIRIGVLGENPFSGTLKSTVQNEAIRGRPIEVKHATRAQDLLDCQLIFVARSERARVPGIISTCAGKPILTVGDMPDFARRGGIVNFYLEGQKVRFEINHAAAQNAHLKLASQLVSVARVVGPPISATVP